MRHLTQIGFLLITCFFLIDCTNRKNVESDRDYDKVSSSTQEAIEGNDDSSNIIELDPGNEVSKSSPFFFTGPVDEYEFDLTMFDKQRKTYCDGLNYSSSDLNAHYYSVDQDICLIVAHISGNEIVAIQKLDAKKGNNYQINGDHGFLCDCN